MPFAPPVTMAVRPDNLAMMLILRTEAANEFFESRELLLDQVDGSLIFQLERLLVELLRGKRHENLGTAEQNDVNRGERLPQMILHPRSAQDAAGGGLQRDRLVLERLVFHARHPVDGVLQAAGNRPVVFRRDDDQSVGAAD